VEGGLVTVRSVGIALLLALILSACESPAPAAVPTPGPASASASASASAAPMPVSVAFVEDLAPDGAIDRVFPALRAVELALETAEIPDTVVQVVPLDVAQQDGGLPEVTERIAGDPAFAAAIVAPELADQGELVERLSAADVPVLSVSARGTADPPSPGRWIRFVAPLDVLARRLAEVASSLRPARRGVCLAEGEPDGTSFPRDVRRGLRDATLVTTAQEASAAGCGVIVWTGGAVGGAELAAELVTTARPPVLVGGPALRDPRFLDLAGPAAEGATAVCACADVTTSLDLAAQRFVQDYQSRFGSTPGPGAAEAWDAARLLVRGLREVGPSRADLIVWLAGQVVSEGLAGHLAFRDGELADPESAVRRYRVEGGRWVEAPMPNSP
jgi:ABC-type branched-subunit amino acid transport system substrate-binding protein